MESKWEGARRARTRCDRADERVVRAPAADGRAGAEARAPVLDRAVGSDAGACAAVTLASVAGCGWRVAVRPGVSPRASERQARVGRAAGRRPGGGDGGGREAAIAGAGALWIAPPQVFLVQLAELELEVLRDHVE